MGPRDGSDTVKLHKSQSFDQVQKVVASGRSDRLFRQCVPVQKQPARAGLVKLKNRQKSAPFQRVAKGNGRGKGDNPLRFPGRFGHVRGNDPGRFAPDL